MSMYKYTCDGLILTINALLLTVNLYSILPYILYNFEIMHSYICSIFYFFRKKSNV